MPLQLQLFAYAIHAVIPTDACFGAANITR